jgi:hypothetical protein
MTPVTVCLPEPTANLKATRLRVTPGVTDAQAVELFAYSQCQFLALAIHEETGWPLRVAEIFREGKWRWVHVGVLAPAGQWLDIGGLRDGRAVTAWLSAWGLPVRLRVMAPGAWHHVLGRPASTPPSWWRTQTAVPELVLSFSRPLVAQARRSSEDGGGS